MKPKPIHKNSYKRNKLDQLRGFVAMVECKSIAEAAIREEVSESTISLQISSLEAKLGVKLFEKEHKNLIISEKGKLYYPKAKKALLGFDEFYEDQDGSGIERENAEAKTNIRERLQKKISEIRKKRLDKYEIILRKKITRLINMIVRLRMRYIIAFIILSSICLCSVYERYLDEGFLDKNTVIMHNVAQGISELDNSMTQALENNMKAWIATEKLRPSKTKEDLVKIRNELKVSILTMWNKDGTMYLNSDGTHLTSGKNYPLYKAFSILNTNICPQYQEMEYAPDTPRTLPIYKSKNRHIPNKLSIAWNVNFQKYFNISYDGQPFVDIINRKASLQSNISYMGLSTPSGIEIVSYNIDKDHMVVKKIAFERYKEKMIINNSRNYLELRMPFGGLQKEVCLQKNNGNANKAGEYFYVLTTVFDKKDVNNQIFIIRITFAVITLVILLILYCVGLKQNGIVDLRKKVKKK